MQTVSTFILREFDPGEPSHRYGDGSHRDFRFRSANLQIRPNPRYDPKATACRSAFRPVLRLADSIYSKRSEEPKTACHRRRLHRVRARCAKRDLSRSSRPLSEVFHQAKKKK